MIRIVQNVKPGQHQLSKGGLAFVPRVLRALDQGLQGLLSALHALWEPFLQKNQKHAQNAALDGMPPMDQQDAHLVP